MPVSCPQVNRALGKLGLDVFRPLQREAVNATLSGRDTFVIMPTGGGKTLCFLLPAVVEDGLTLVISPLKSLMLDQVEQIQRLGVTAVRLTGDTSREESRGVFRSLLDAEACPKLL